MSAELSNWAGDQLVLIPELRGEDSVSLSDSGEGSLNEVTLALGLTSGTGVGIFNTSKGQDLLGGSSADESSTTGSRDQSHEDGADLTGELHGDGVGLSELTTPVSTTNRDDSELGSNDGTTNGSGDFAGALDTETDVTIVITDDDKGLEASTLTGTSLLLDWHDLEDFILKLGAQEVINDLEFLDGQRVEIDLLQLLYLAVLDETTELGAGDPDLSFSLVTSASATAITATSTTTTSTVSSSSSSSAIARQRLQSCRCSSSGVVMCRPAPLLDEARR